MLLIDVNALIEESESGGWDVDIEELRMILKYVPTIDAMPVVRGEWERMTNPYGELEGFMCACGRTSQSADNYCPNCGADMRGRA